MECPKQLLGLPVTAGARVTLVALWTFASPGKLLVWPSVRRLCELTGFAERSVRRHLDDLEKEGAIRREDPGRRGTVIWVLTETPVRGRLSPDRGAAERTEEPSHMTETPVERTEVASPSNKANYQTKTTPANARASHVGEPITRESRARNLEGQIVELRERLQWSVPQPTVNGSPVGPLRVRDSDAREVLRAGYSVGEIVDTAAWLSGEISAGRCSPKPWGALFWSRWLDAFMRREVPEPFRAAAGANGSGPSRATTIEDAIRCERETGQLPAGWQRIPGAILAPNGDMTEVADG